MNAVIFVNEHARATLTTEAAGSRYGIPVLRIDIHGSERDWPDMGPADALPSGITAAELVCRVAWAMDDATRDAARRFCSQWQDGPQVSAV